MLTIGSKLTLNSGRIIQIQSTLKPGGQGTAYKVTDLKTREHGVFKLFKDEYATPENVERIRFLIKQRFLASTPLVLLPIDYYFDRHQVGHYSPWAEGVELESFLEDPKVNFSQLLQLAIATAHGISVMHGRSVAHGDLHPGNFMVATQGEVLSLRIIDHDNFAAPGVPGPSCAGHNLYMAPELCEALAKGRAVAPNIETDRYSLGVLLHTILLLHHPASGNDGDEASFQKAMYKGEWLLDPSHPNRPKQLTGGYPSAVLNTGLARLFRASFSRDPSARPSAEQWKTELLHAFHQIFLCPACSGPCVIDVSKITCPWCSKPFPLLTLNAKRARKVIALGAGATAIGRADLGGSLKVSARHAVFRRIGPEYWIESFGSNGSFRWNGKNWLRLPDQKPLLVQKGDLLRFGDVDLTVN